MKKKKGRDFWFDDRVALLVMLFAIVVVSAALTVGILRNYAFGDDVSEPLLEPYETVEPCSEPWGDFPPLPTDYATPCN